MNIPKITPGYIAFFLGLFAIIPQFYKLVITQDRLISLIFIILSISSQILWVCQGLFVTKDDLKLYKLNSCIILCIYIIFIYFTKLRKLNTKRRRK